MGPADRHGKPGVTAAFPMPQGKTQQGLANQGPVYPLEKVMVAGRAE